MKPRISMDGHGCGTEIVVTTSRQSIQAGIVSAGWQILHTVGAKFLTLTDSRCGHRRACPGGAMTGELPKMTCGSQALRGACPHGSNDCELSSHSLRGDEPHGDGRCRERLM